MALMQATPIDSPWLVPTVGASPGVSTALARRSKLLLIEDRTDFRQTVARSLACEGMRVLEAVGVYDAWRLAQGESIDLIVVRGDLRAGSGWQCAAKLCGHPPWHGVLLYFEKLTGRDRTWARAAGVSRPLETCGEPDKLTAGVLRSLA